MLNGICKFYKNYKTDVLLTHINRFKTDVKGFVWENGVPITSLSFFLHSLHFLIILDVWLTISDLKNQIPTTQWILK